MATGPAPTGGTTERMSGLVEALDLDPIQKEALRLRWLDQARWMSARARSARRRYYLLRLPVVIGGVAVPGLVSITLANARDPGLDWLRWVTFGVSLAVAIMAALEEVFHYGERWRHYRRTAETLKALGWQFLGLNGAFARFEAHKDAFKPFTTRVEEVLSQDVEGFLESVTPEGGQREKHEIYH